MSVSEKFYDRLVKEGIIHDQESMDWVIKLLEIFCETFKAGEA